MRTIFVSDEELEARFPIETVTDPIFDKMLVQDNYAPWAGFIEKVDGGFKAFESSIAFKAWKNQK